MDRSFDRKIRLTYEHGVWALIGFLALVMRLALLGAAPLAAGEVREAILAWRAATGQGMPLANYNPLLLTANCLLFTLFGADDVVARLVPALFGATLTLTPLLFRRHLGRVGTPAVALLLAVSPTGLAASRQLDGTVIAATGAIAFLGGWLRFAETERSGWLTFAAVGLGLGVTGGPSLYGLLLPVGLACTIFSQLRMSERQRVPAFKASTLTGYLPRFVLTFLVSTLAFATGLGWNAPGIGASGGHLVAWWGRFRPVSHSTSSPLTLLTVYELGVTVLGIGGLIWGVKQRNPTASLLGLWAGFEVLLLTLMPGRAPTDVLWAVLPLTMLAGLAMEWLTLHDSSSDASLPAAHFAIVLALWVYSYLMLARYAAFGDRADLALALTAVVLQGLVGLGFGLILGGPETFRAAARGTAVVLLALSLRAGWRVAYQRPADPREVLVRQPTASNVRDLVRTLQDISWQETGVPLALAFTLEAPQDSVLAWYLRDFGMARRVDELGGWTASDLGSVVVTYDRDDTLTAAADEAYVGQDFPLEHDWSLGDLGCRLWEPGCRDAAKWFLFREGGRLPEAHRWATLWRLVDEPQGE